HTGDELGDRGLRVDGEGSIGVVEDVDEVDQPHGPVRGDVAQPRDAAEGPGVEALGEVDVVGGGSGSCTEGGEIESDGRGVDGERPHGPATHCYLDSRAGNARRTVDCRSPVRVLVGGYGARRKTGRDIAERSVAAEGRRRADDVAAGTETRRATVGDGAVV